MENRQQSESFANIGGAELAASGFEMEVPTRIDEVNLESPTEVSQEDAR
jgi:hypothetical protein